jgi:hypothetical protein
VSGIARKSKGRSYEERKETTVDEYLPEGQQEMIRKN